MNRLRSVLYLPASNSRAITKARTLPCDAVILDLEDAVAPEQKEVARELGAAALRDGGFGERQVAVRINGFDTAWGAADAAALRDVATVVLLPKVDGLADLMRARAALGPVPALWAMVETCAGVLALPAIAAAARAHGLTTLVAGTNDLAKEMRCGLDARRTALLPVLSHIVIAARAAGILAVDGVCNALDDPNRLTTECRQGRLLGFDGKSLIHPGQIAAANAAFGPTAEDIAWAEAVVAAFDQPGNVDKGAVRLNGAMVERLHLTEAHRILAQQQGLVSVVGLPKGG